MTPPPQKKKKRSPRSVWLSSVTIQSCHNIIGSLPCAVYYVYYATYLFSNWECVPLNLLTYSEVVARGMGVWDEWNR